MTVLFSDGFESGDFSAWTSTSGTPSVQSIIKHSGIYAALFSGSTDKYCQKTISEGDCYLRAYVYFDSLPSASHYVSFFDTYDSIDDSLEVGVTIYNDSGTVKWGIRHAPYGTPPENLASTGPTAQIWYCVELSVHRTDNTHVSYQLWVNGVSVISSSYVTSSSTHKVNSIYILGADKSESISNYVDAVVVADRRIYCEKPLFHILRGRGGDKRLGTTYHQPYTRPPHY